MLPMGMLAFVIFIVVFVLAQRDVRLTKSFEKRNDPDYEESN